MGGQSRSSAYSNYENSPKSRKAGTPIFEVMETPLHDAHVQKYKAYCVGEALKSEEFQKFVVQMMAMQLGGRNRGVFGKKKKPGQWSLKNRVAWLILKLIGER